MTEWKFIPPQAMTMNRYSCGFAAGDRVRLRKDLVIRDHGGRPTGTVYPAGEVWTVLKGNPSEPETVWLRQPDGKPHTWDDGTMSEWFEPVHEEE